MAELEDERIRFYLRHREQIETWAALRSEAAVAIDGLLERVADDVDALSGELGPDVVVTTQLEGETYPHFLLHRSSWGLDASAPRAAIGLEWARNKTFLSGTASPYVGARFAINDNATRLVRNRFRDLTQPVRASRGDKATPWWPCLRLVPAEKSFWEDFGAYRERLLFELRSAWDAYASVIETLVLEEREDHGEG